MATDTGKEQILASLRQFEADLSTFIEAADSYLTNLTDGEFFNDQGNATVNHCLADSAILQRKARKAIWEIE